MMYQILKTLAHSDNKKTTAAAISTAYNPYKAELFLKHLGPRLMNYQGQTVLDVGCGTGNLAILLAKNGAKHVFGVDIDAERVATAQRLAVQQGVADRVTFHAGDFNAYQPPQLVDLALNEDAFEHIAQPLEALRKIHSCLVPGGQLATIFGPLWGSPYGAHCWGFSRVPWLHFLFPERVVLQVRAEMFRPDEPATRYEQIRGGLNKMTVAKFNRLATQAGFAITWQRLNPPQDHGKWKLLNHLVNGLPLLNELGALQYAAVLQKKGG